MYQVVYFSLFFNQIHLQNRKDAKNHITLNTKASNFYPKADQFDGVGKTFDIYVGRCECSCQLFFSLQRIDKLLD